MSDPIKIVVTADTAEAAAALQKFIAGTGSGLAAVEKAAHGSAAGLNSNRIAMMELGHSARSVADGLAAGMNPLRLMMMEAPRLSQAYAEASAEMRSKLVSVLPLVGGGLAVVTAALAVGSYWWSNYGESMVDPAKRAREMADALDKIPSLLDKINTAQKAGSISPAQANKYLDLLSGKTPLYNEQTVPDAYGGHAPRYGKNPYGAAGDDLVQLSTNEEQTIPFVAWSQGSKRQLANPKDRSDYIRQMMEKDQAIDANDNSKPADQALAKLHEEEIKMQRDAETGIQKEIDRIRDRYELERREIIATKNVAAATAGLNGNLPPGEDAKFNAALDASKSAEQASILELQQKHEAEVSQQLAEAQAKVKEQFAKDAAEQIQALDDQITAHQDQAGVQRGQLAAQEYQQRIALAERLYYSGEIEEDEYTHLVSEAAKKRTASEKEYNEELKKTAQLKQEIARAQTEVQLRTIDSDPMLTDEQKNRQSIPLYSQLMAQNSASMAGLTDIAQNSTDVSARLEAQKQLTDLMGQQVELQNQLNAANGRDSFAFQFSAMMTKLQNAGGSVQQQTAEIFGTAWTGGINSVSKSLTGLIEGTTTWKKALLEISQSTLGELIQGFIHMGVQWVATHVLMTAASKVFSMFEKNSNAESVWTTISAAITKLEANAAVAGSGAAAAEASIPYVGPALAVAAMGSMMSSVLALGSGFQGGGFTGNISSDAIAGFVHGGEFVFSQPAVNRIGLDTLTAMHQGDLPSSGGGAGGGADNNSMTHKVVVVMDRQGLLNEFKKQDFGKITVAHVFNNRLQAGIKT